MKTPWNTRNRGGVLGNAIFVFLIRHFGLSPAYLLLRFVTLYFIPFAPGATKALYRFYRQKMHYSRLKSFVGIYKNYNMFGEAILDKIALLSGVDTNFQFTVEGDEHLTEIVKQGNGGLLLSAHVGNWEMAGQMLGLLSETTPVSILLYQIDHDRVRRFIDDTVQNKRSFTIIPIKKNSMDHVFSMSRMLSDGGLVCFHIDRYIPGSQTVTASLFGSPVRLPAGPYYLAAQFGVPIIFVFTVKTGRKKYHTFVSRSHTISRVRDKQKQKELAEQAAAIFAEQMESVVKRYPYQWFNYYDFWADEQ